MAAPACSGLGHGTQRRRHPSLGSRRRGSFLILVVALLGILFVVGITFLATMNFEAESVAGERALRANEAQIDVVLGESGSELQSSFIGITGAPFGWYETAIGIQSTYAELPEVHPHLSQVEPFKTTLDQSRYVFTYVTDMHRMLAGMAAAYVDRTNAVNDPGYVVTSEPVGSNLGGNSDDPDWDPTLEPERLLLDADGDGINDTRAINLLDTIWLARDDLGNPIPGVPAIPADWRAWAAEVSADVIPPDAQTQQVWLGMRIVPHGGMVNLNYGHPLLIESLLGTTLDSDNDGLAEGLARWPYSSLVEEPALRHRGGATAPRYFSPTALLGNPYEDADVDGYPLDDGDLGRLLMHGPSQAFTGSESVLAGLHRYWLYGPDEVDMTLDPNMPLWGVRMDPGYGTAYDRRHCVAIDSWDDLLARPVAVRTPTGTPGVDIVRDFFDVMVEANQSAWDPDQCLLLPFEYANYPHNIANIGPNGGVCDCPTDALCSFDEIKGRLQLSLPWLEDNVASGKISSTQMTRMIYDVFVMMLMNARGAYWDNIDDLCTNNLECGPGQVIWPDGISTFTTQGMDARMYRISTTAAALTANLIDFMDADDIPTRVALRYFNFVDDARTLGQELEPKRYFYGIERQPYITEIAESSTGSYAVELFNPYRDTIETAQGAESFYILRRNGDSLTDVAITLPLFGNTGNVGYTDNYIVLTNNQNDPEFMLPASGVQEDSNVIFSQGDVIQLIRRVYYDDPNVADEIVVDQFDVVGATIGAASGLPVSKQRPLVSSANVLHDDLLGNKSPWYATLPACSDEEWVGIAGVSSLDTLHEDNAPAQGLVGCGTLHPVEAIQANTGSMKTAFPTTGSLLLLLRHANRSANDTFVIDESGDDKKDYAFTAHLWDALIDDGSGGVDGRSVHDQVDNGHMPVFDVGFRHRISPANTTVTPLATPGDIDTLPWGQLVFDYFTALPLSNEGPYSRPAGSNEPPTYDLLAGPKVDQDGLRVHGRVNLNAAPWSVLAGLPLMPPESTFSAWPVELRERIARFAGFEFDTDPNDDKPITIGTALAQAIQAYREQRAIPADDPTAPTGNYGDPGIGRGWQSTSPAFRRGTGFLTVGELANVRSAGAASLGAPPQPTFGDYLSYSYFRTDGGMLNASANHQDYVESVALLVSLGDWVTVRSHVFTVYGVIRGGGTDSTGAPLPASELDNRAIRFQETIDRLPTFRGASEPARIGQRIIGNYASP